MTPGTKLGPYEIVERIGAGGMGEVYRARDPRLGREVAIKVSAEQFSDRFAREARAIAALNHPHICTLHDVGANYLVMELIGGETLADRLRRAPMPVDEALAIGKQVAAALRAAHDRGIVHRDLKPANVKITPDGRVKVLDFGLAKLEQSNAAIALDDSPTEPATRAGAVVGTAAYMSPEQARGQDVDKRTDIWSFGAMVYEMVSGRRPFQGATATDTIAAILTAEPSWDAVPPRVRPLVQRCLQKDAQQRLRDIGDIDLLLDGAAEVRAPKRSWLPWAAAALLLVTLGPMAVTHFRERPQPANPIRFQIPQTVNLATSGNIGLSPDGRHLAFLAMGDDGRVRLYVRTMDSLEVRPLGGSEMAAHAPPFFWSPDSKFIAFDAGGALKKLNIAGGAAQTLCELAAPAIGGSWNRNGDIILGNIRGGILRVPENGGAANEITALDPTRAEDSHLLPTFLPDGRHFVYLRVSRTKPALAGVYVGDLHANPREQNAQRLSPYAIGLTYVPASAGPVGRLLFVQEGNLMAQPFDQDRRALAGDASLVAEGVGVYLDGAFFSASVNNVLVYRRVDPDLPLTWIDRQGNAIGLAADPSQYGSVALSPDGTRAAVSRPDRRDSAIADLWLLDLTRNGVATRFASTPGVKSEFPEWSPDGKRIVFRHAGPGGVSLYQKSTEMSQGDAAQLVSEMGGGLSLPTSWSPDGAFVMFAHVGGPTLWDLWVARVGQPSSPLPFATTQFSEEDGRFSPDGTWVAYTSNESGTKDVYVRRFSADTGRTSAGVGAGVLVSRGGGSAPRWRRDGKELFYLSANGVMMSVTVETGGTFRAGSPTPLFQAPPNAIVGDVTADGKRFLFGQRATAPFTVMLNWMRED